MEYEHEYVHSKYQLLVPKPSTHPRTSPTSPQTINFLISFSFTNRVWKLRHPLSPHFLLSDAHRPLMDTTLAVTLENFRQYNQTYSLLEDHIKPWPISPQSRKRMIESAIPRAQVAVKSLHGTHNDDVYVKVLFVVVRNQVVRQPGTNRGRAIDPVGRCCSVCLEEFCEAWEGVYIPCSHVFHQHCIQKWLRINHTCPLCRFEMPTQTRFRIDFKVSDHSNHG